MQKVAVALYFGQEVPRGVVTDNTPRLTERNLQIAQLYIQGQSISQLSRDFGITPQRVWQIIREN